MKPEISDRAYDLLSLPSLEETSGHHPDIRQPAPVAGTPVTPKPARVAGKGLSSSDISHLCSQGVYGC